MEDFTQDCDDSDFGMDAEDFDFIDSILEVADGDFRELDEVPDNEPDGVAWIAEAAEAEAERQYFKRHPELNP